ncbi:hypothetical protein BB560_002895 [Smittium megazygosporum]|uniref:RNA helicase n=1 Tax=Smittium megazygosporum TaxID=133381 RepID=A0A2T9ZDN2_9FUNG|nr:hypothetical protein BB560_002895 [Smittium megazygosporum]
MAQNNNTDQEDYIYSDHSDEYVPVRFRSSEISQVYSKLNVKLPSKRDNVHQKAQKSTETEILVGPTAKVSLVDQTVDLKRRQIIKEKTEQEKQLEEEMALMEAVSKKKKLTSASEIAQGVVYTEPMKTSWRPFKRFRNMPESEKISLRQKLRIIVDGEDIPPPIISFDSMRFPKPILKYLYEKNITIPSPIQMQGLPIASNQKEVKLPFEKGEGPVGILLSPSRELAQQTHDGILEISRVLKEGGYPEIRSLLCIGGISMNEQQYTLNKGVHIVVATPGRLQDMLQKGKLKLDNCIYMCLDEADRMIGFGFEEDVRNIMSFFKEFAQSALVKPIIVNVGRSGAASLDVLQNVEYVKQEMRIVHLLDTLQKTAPPVLIFAENKTDVDNIMEYLLLKGVEAVSIHGGKSQEERNYAISNFRSGNKDVLVATDVASKGLDFAGIKHVINFDMPRDIEDYVHRIGRTGRSGKTGLATTYVNTSSSDQILLDLKHLLIESKQNVPAFLYSIYDPSDKYRKEDDSLDTSIGCAFCGGLGHRILDCPKLEAQRRLERSGMRNQSEVYGNDY